MFKSISTSVMLTLCFALAHADAALEPAKTIAAEVASGVHPGFESFIMQVDGVIVGRTVDPTLAKRPPDLRSATKSITALLIGIAIDRGAIPSVQSKVMDLLPSLRTAFENDPRKAAMTLEDLLTMRSGLDCNDWDPKSPGQEDKMYRQQDWVAFWSELKMRTEPGKEFSYCTGNVVALGEILADAVSMSADAFALKYLFIPLEARRAEWRYYDGKRGVDTGGHLRLEPDDLLKVGELVLARGAYKGKRIVSEAWIDAMTQERTGISGMNQRYGYLWWLDHTKDPNLPQTKLWWAQGNGGSLLMVMPELRAVMVTTGTRFNRPDMLEPMFWLRDRLLPAMRPGK
ncbi:serine hydrolase domain-containing protein [Steroidobacter agaridevorans]|uniref:serine hydrolase domain-containing protein n=1 Tax=Steroidobacter agaridevorans TaxID=2695856 RepID=UPI001379C221|nr:serine hydrolase [Steroidobacter agaridevorans]